MPMSIAGKKMDEIALDKVTGGAMGGSSEDTRPCYCSNCKMTFRIPVSKVSGKCPECGRTVNADITGSLSGTVMKA